MDTMKKADRPSVDHIIVTFQINTAVVQLRPSHVAFKSSVFHFFGIFV